MFLPFFTFDKKQIKEKLKKSVGKPTDIIIKKPFSEDVQKKIEGMTISRSLNGEIPLYRESANRMFKRLTPFSEKEKNEIINMLTVFEDGGLVGPDDIYHRFVNKVWYWEELEFWRERLKTGPIPYYLALQLSEVNAYSIAKGEDVFKILTLPKAKKILLENGFDVPKKSIKKTIIEMCNNNSLYISVLKQEAIAYQKKNEFNLLINTIRSRFESLVTLHLFKKCRLDFVEEEDMPFIEMVQRRFPEIVPPYWPMSLITYRGTDWDDLL